MRFIKQQLKSVIPYKLWLLLKKNKINLFPANKYEKFIKKIQGIPFNNLILEEMRNYVRLNKDIYYLDEKEAKSLADSWDGIIETPKNIRFIDNSIPVVLCANEGYAPYLAVTLQSLLDHSNPQKKYHFIIFERNFSDYTKKSLKKQASSFTHCELDFIDISKVFYTISIRSPFSHLSVDAFSRLFIPYWFNEYSKIIYLDCDMIAKADIGLLYDIDITGYDLGAVIFDFNGFGSGDYSRVKTFLTGAYILHGNNVINYFNSGVLIFNTKRFKERISCEELFRFVIYYTNRYKKRFNDQDILNTHFGGNFLILPQDWNYRWGSMGKNGKYYNPASTDTKIIHFTTSIKPWKDNKLINKNPDTLYYREYAKKVPLYKSKVLLSKNV